MNKIDELKLILREEDCPFFKDEELAYYLSKFTTLEQTAHHCLILKSEDTTISVSGLSTADSSRYFLRLAQKYRKSNSGILKGG